MVLKRVSHYPYKGGTLKRVSRYPYKGGALKRVSRYPHKGGTLKSDGEEISSPFFLFRGGYMAELKKLGTKSRKKQSQPGLSLAQPDARAMVPDVRFPDGQGIEGIRGVF